MTACGRFWIQRRVTFTLSSAYSSLACASRRASSCSVQSGWRSPMRTILRRVSSVRARKTSSSQRRTAACQNLSWSSSQSWARRISASAASRAWRASAAKPTRAARKSCRAATDVTLADSLTADLLALRQVLLDALGLAHQEGDVLVGQLDEAGDDGHGLLELLGELGVLLVAPGVAQAEHLAVQHRHAVLQLVVE